MKTTFISFLLFSCTLLQAQRVINVEMPASGEIQLSDDVVIPKINPGYTLWLPDKGNPVGLIVFTHERRDTLQTDFMIDYALKNQLAVLYATTDNRVEFFFDNQRMLEIEAYIREVITDWHIPQANLLYCGMSLEGTRALKLAIFGQGPLSRYHLHPKAIAICDAPLDMVRFHKEGTKAKNLNFNPIAADEGAWVTQYLQANLGGTPLDTLPAYIQYSPYCYLADGGESLQYLQSVALRAYTEPDVNWWIETRRKDYYGMNAIDLAALVNELKISGNTKAELIITQDKGYSPEGKRHPHNWSIVDEKELIDWFLGLIK